MTPTSQTLWGQLRRLLSQRRNLVRESWDRSLAFGDYISDRWDKARELGWGEESSVYDSCLVLGSVSVGERVWVGPYTILDGSGTLTIGSGCTVSAGTHIYTHDNVAQTVSGGRAPIDRQAVSIGDDTYIGPNVVVTKGCQIGSRCVIGAGSLVRRDVPDNSLVVGTPGRVVARVVVNGESVRFDYSSVEA